MKCVDERNHIERAYKDREEQSYGRVFGSLSHTEVIRAHVIQDPLHFQPHNQKNRTFQHEFDHAPILPVGKSETRREVAWAKKTGDESGHDRGNQAGWLAAQLGGWSVAYAGSPPAATTGRFGNAVLSRRPIEASAHADLPYVPDGQELPRLAVHARTGGVDVFSTHLAWQLHDSALREQQVRALVDFVAEDFLRPRHRALLLADAEPEPLLDRLLTWTPPAPQEKWIGKEDV